MPSPVDRSKHFFGGTLAVNLEARSATRRRKSLQDLRAVTAWIGKGILRAPIRSGWLPRNIQRFPSVLPLRTFPQRAG